MKKACFLKTEEDHFHQDQESQSQLQAPESQSEITQDSKDNMKLTKD
jgi:hypothetical protein